MDAAIQGALEAEKPVGGFKIAKEAGEWTTSNFHPYLPPKLPSLSASGYLHHLQVPELSDGAK
jgi:hypothetical protein